jgi:hypothetical protein
MKVRWSYAIMIFDKMVFLFSPLLICFDLWCNF